MTIHLLSHASATDARYRRRRLGSYLGIAAAAALCLLGGPAARAQALLNGNFATGDFTDWTFTGDPSSSAVSTGDPITGLTPPGGDSFLAYFGEVGDLGFISQTVDAPTVVGQEYGLFFSLANGGPDGEGGSPAMEFQIAINGVTDVDEFSATGFDAFGFTPYVYDFNADSTSTTVTFGFRNDPTDFDLDDVSFAKDDGPTGSLNGPSLVPAVAAPEPTSLALLAGAAAPGAALLLRRRRRAAA